MFLTLASSLLLTNNASAQNKPLACQGDASAGLKWVDGRWTVKTFILDKFILVQTKDGLTADSAAKALSTDYPNHVSCRNSTISIACQDRSGGFLFFDPRTLKGGVSQIIGGTGNGTTRDDVTVQVFSCTPF